MAIPSVSASRSVHGCPIHQHGGGHDQISPMVESVVSKLNLGLGGKKGEIDEIRQAINESVVLHLSHFSKKAISLITTGKAPTALLFMIIASYLAGEKIKDPLPEFILDLFDKRDIGDIEHDRKLIQGGAVSFFSLKDGARRSLESFYDWSKLNEGSTKEKIAALFLRSDLRPLEPHRETISEGEIETTYV